MTVKDFAALAGVSHQAIYKKLKGRGVSLDAIKDKETGQLTQEGETLLREIYSLSGQQESSEEAASETTEAAPPAEEQAGKKLRNQVAELEKEVERLRNQVATLEEKEKALTEERNFLRMSLERSQQLQALTASKIPNLAPGLPAGGDQAHGLRGWWQRLRSGRRRGSDQPQGEE